jgi:spore maturation protein A
MLNYIWFALMAIALVVAIFTGTAPAVTKGAIDSAKTGVDIALGLVGIMTLWLGIMRVAEKAGLIALLGRLLRPFSRLLFPEVPPEHPAIGAMIMNVAANMLGLSNAATPLGIKAMEELQTLNDGDKETATNAMVTFMALNTAGIQLIPATIVFVNGLVEFSWMVKIVFPAAFFASKGSPGYFQSAMPLWSSICLVT